MVKNGIIIKIYEKIVNYTKANYDYFISKFNDVYPNNSELFNDRIRDYMKQHENL